MLGDDDSEYDLRSRHDQGSNHGSRSPKPGDPTFRSSQATTSQPYYWQRQVDWMNNQSESRPDGLLRPAAPIVYSISGPDQVSWLNSAAAEQRKAWGDFQEPSETTNIQPLLSTQNHNIELPWSAPPPTLHGQSILAGNSVTEASRRKRGRPRKARPQSAESPSQITPETDWVSSPSDVRIIQYNDYSGLDDPIPSSGQKKRSRKTGQRGGWSKGTKLGPREVRDPGEPFNSLHAGAMKAFLDESDNQKAKELILEAIAINPEIHAAHVLLSQIHDANGEPHNAMAALFAGAHASPNDPHAWWTLASRCQESQEVESEAERLTNLQGAFYAYSRILGIDRDDVEARFEKAIASKELDMPTKALRDLEYLQKQSPADPRVRKLIAEICLDIGEVDKARQIYEERLDSYQRGDLSDQWDVFWADLIVYVDVIDFAEGSERASWCLKHLARWFLGRADEEFWDQIVEDDREWDAEDDPRRIELPQFVPNVHLTETYGSGLPMELRVKLGDIRLRSGHRDEALGHFEWLHPEDLQDGANIYEFPDLFLQVANELREIKEHKEALRFYQALVHVNAYQHATFWMGVGASAYVCGDKAAALQYFENAKAADPSNGEAQTQLSKIYTDRGDRVQALQNAREAIQIFEKMTPKTTKRQYERKETRQAREEAEKALRNAYRLPRGPGDPNSGPTPSFSRRAKEKARRAEQQAKDADIEDAIEGEDNTTQTEKTVRRRRKRYTKKFTRSREQQIANVQQVYSTLTKATQGMQIGNEEDRNIWMDCAEELIDEFRNEKAFYPRDKSAQFQGYDQTHFDRAATSLDNSEEAVWTIAPNKGDTIVPSVETDVPKEFCGIDFETWLDIFLEHALLLAKSRCVPSECYAIIESALTCNLWYHDPNATLHIYICYLTCTFVLQDELTLFNTVLRWFMREYAFCSDAYRLFSAINLYYPHETDKGNKDAQMINARFRVPPTQKFLLRHITTLDKHLPETYGSDTTYGPKPQFMHTKRRQSGHDIIHNAELSREHSPSRPHRSESDQPLDPQVTSQSLHSNATAPSQVLDHGSTRLQTFQPEEMDPILLTLYAQILYAGGSFPNAMSYLYRALSLSPQNPSILLTLALCYIHNVVRKQNEDRHMNFLQGWAIFEMYAEARIKRAWVSEKKNGNSGVVWSVQREIAFNRARCWQMVGLADISLRAYQKTLDLRRVKDEDEMDLDDRGREDKAYSMEAAYAMASIYALNGNVESAREITETYLVIE